MHLDDHGRRCPAYFVVVSCVDGCAVPSRAIELHTGIDGSAEWAR